MKTQSNIEAATAYKRANPHHGRAVLIRKFGLSDREARRISSAVLRGKPDAAQQPDRQPMAQRIRPSTIEEFRKIHDIPQKIRDRICGLRAGTYVTEEELRQLCGVHVNSWRRNAELPEFSSCKLRVEGVTYWAQSETIDEMKRITGRA